MTEQAQNANAIAIIGMAGRFPGAKNVDELWQLLKSGRHAITMLSDAELLAAGVSPSLIKNPNYVKTCVPLDGYDKFDAGFFGYSPRQATSLDPQARLFMECAWESLEHAGYDPEKYDGVMGIFGGSGSNLYLYTHMQELIEANSGNWHQTSLDGEKDFLTMRVSYKLGLNGPSVAVQSACSSSLVAVHLACQSLLTFESDIVLAGGVSIKLNQNSGYMYEEGGIASKDGICRAYDADATGTIGGSGCGIVVLKRLDEAVRDGDEIHAVIRGTAVNNDGADKAGFSAPGIKAQARLIASALAFAELQPTDIGMLEGHGTGTVLGDAVELTALGEAFDTGTAAKKWCALGSIKSNIGHLDCAAGVAGLIKAVLCLKHKHFVPSVNFSKSNPALESTTNPFYVSTEYVPWHSDDKPRRAGVSSFGMGGTNAHVVVEEAPHRELASATDAPQLFPLSAHTGEALQQLSAELASYIEARSQLDLADVAYTLQTGRRRFAHRRTVVAATAAELVHALRGAPSQVLDTHDQHSDRPVIFMFPGQGSQQPGAVQMLYDSDRFFRASVDECAALFQTRLGFDIRPFICKSDDITAVAAINRTLITQPAVFTVGYSLARLWMHWGVKPAAMVGHSVGEYVAACVSGAISLQDCTTLLAQRAQLVNAQPAGAMLAVRLAVDSARDLLKDTLSIAAVNSPSQCVISGPIDEIGALERVLAERGVEHHKLPVSHAFHSRLMEPAMPALEHAAQGCRFEKPHLPYVSCLTGKPVESAAELGASFWARHLREPVDFQAALAAAAACGSAIWLELGIGQALSGLARQQFGNSAEHAYVGSLAGDGSSDRTALLHQLARLWSLGAAIDWAAFHRGSPRGRVGLVTYPFQRQRYWIQSKKREITLREEQPAAHVETSIPALPAVSAVMVASGWTELEASMAALWEEVLGIEVVGRNDTFMSLGGDSLIALRVIARVKDDFDVKISPKVLISSSGTVKALAAEIVEQLASEVDEADMEGYLDTSRLDGGAYEHSTAQSQEGEVCSMAQNTISEKYE